MEAALAAIRRERGRVKGKVSRIESLLAQVQDGIKTTTIEEIDERIAQLREAKLAFDIQQIRLLEVSEEENLCDRDQAEDDEFDERVVRVTAAWRALRSNIVPPPPPATLDPVQNNDVNSGSQRSDGEPTPLASERQRQLSGVNVELLQILQQQAELLKHLADNRNAGGQRESQVKLPVVQLPMFDGKIEEWKRYSETFKALVHDRTELSNIQKYQYLTSSVSGTAAKLIESIDISNANYEVAWELLKKRYDDPRSIKKKHIHCLFEMPRVEREAASAIRELVDHTQKHLRVLKAMQLPTDAWDELILYMIEVKLDNTTRREWERQAEADDAPTVEKIMDFLQKRCQILERLQASTKSKENVNKNTATKSDKETSNGSSSRKSVNNKQNKPTSSNVTSRATEQTENKSGKCYLCSGSHFIYFCPNFLGLTIEERINEARRLRLCLNCLRNDHFVKTCKGGSCRQCSGRHNTLCHLPRDKAGSAETTNSDTPTPSAASSVANKEEASSNNVTTMHQSLNRLKRVLMSTALVTANHANGTPVSIRALLDSASEANFITDAACNRLGLRTGKICEPIVGLNEMKSQVTQDCNVVVTSRHSNLRINVHCLVVPRITNELPSFKFDSSELSIPNTIKLADPFYHDPSKVEMLIGAEFFQSLLETGKIKLGDDKPTLQNTALGWVLAGPMPTRSCRSPDISVLVCSRNSISSLNENVTRFWNIEEIKSENSMQIVSKNESECERMFETATRDESGRFIVRLPICDSINELGESRQVAEKRLLALERRFKGNDILRQRYTEFMREYIELNHMSPVSSTKITSELPVVYLPHHGVIRETSTTTKLRVVFDASAKTSSGKSLNDVLLVGPTVQDNLLDILLRFRLHKVAFTADIQKMYRQILVDPRDRDFQRILWRFSVDEPIQEYRLNTVTYGQACAPYLAIRAIRQLAQDEKTEFPTAANIVLRDFYVDDVLSGANSIAEAKTLCMQLKQLLQRGGFELHKWSSNDDEIVTSMRGPTQEISSPTSINDGDSVKTLGLQWLPTNDEFKFSINIDVGAKTKREILSAISKLFDPLGVIGPIIVRAKLIMQASWSHKVEWDAALPQELLNEWNDYVDDIQNVGTIQVPRRVIQHKESSRLSLHGFCDASERAYGACLYIQSEDGEGHKTSSLLCSKSRVAPIKKITLPRLELCGAVLLTRLVQAVNEALKIEFDDVRLWTDSTIVLAWIAKESSHWQTFVANRISEIQSSSSYSQWGHVSGKENPADLVSRGVSCEKLENNTLWWAGPSWLQTSEELHSSPEELNHSDEVQEIINAEAKKRKTMAVNVARCQPNQFLEDFTKAYSSISKMERLLAYCQRFIKNCRKKPEERETGNLSPGEINSATELLLKHVQATAFTDEVEGLRKEEVIKSSSKLLSLDPFIDKNGLIRVGGRLQKAKVNFQQRHQILLPDTHRLTILLVEREHLRLLHAGPQALLAAVRTRYWPLNGRNLARRIFHKCIVCYKANPTPVTQIMGSLPTARVQPSRPFFVTGVDFAGPIVTLVNKGRGRKTTKSYIALFICFATKAIHLEAVSELTTAAFLATLRRFVARRGCPQQIHSDNGTNFVGANRELREVFEFIRKEVDNSKLQQLFSENNIQWSFIPPRSPHMGGLWEAGVKSCKFHLKRIVGQSMFTFEELATVLAQIEAILNSRPLTPMSSDPADCQPLTPGHFLVGEPLTSVPDLDITDVKLNRLNRWQLIQRNVQEFWKRWSSEYLSNLQEKTKWKRTQENLSIDDLVMIHDEALPPTKWMIGRVIELHPSHDQKVRVVTIKTPNGTTKRAISKLCKLPIQTKGDSGQKLIA